MAVAVGSPVPEELARAPVLDASGASAPLGSYFGDDATLLVFLRHFGCIGCSIQVAEIAPRLRQFHELGLRSVFIGNGNADHIAGFVERHGLGDKSVTIVTDPTLKTYASLHLPRSIWATFGPRAVLEALQARGRGLQNYRTEGDDLQQGGLLLLDGDHVVVHRHGNRSLGDVADTGDVVDDAMRLLIRRQPPKQDVI